MPEQEPICPHRSVQTNTLIGEGRVLANFLMKTRTVNWEVEHDQFPSHYFTGELSALHSFSHVGSGTSPAMLFPMAADATDSGSFVY